MPKAFALFLVALLIGSVASPMTCVGWQASASDRHACCLRAHHAHANDQAAADDCCARHEQGRQSEHATRPLRDEALGLVVGTSSLLGDISDIVRSAAILHEQAPHPSPPDLSPPPLRI